VPTEAAEVGLATCGGFYANSSPESKALSSGLAIAELRIEQVSRKNSEKSSLMRGSRSKTSGRNQHGTGY
jgi:hypothetical protein